MNLNKLSNIQNVLDNMTSSKFAAGANCVVIENGIEQGYFQSGLSDIENNISLSRDTIFRLYSMSKTVTSVATMMLVEKGVIDLYENVANYLPGFSSPIVCASSGKNIPAGREVRIQDLLDMTSGVSYPGDANDSEISAAVLMNSIVEKMDTDSALTTVEIANKSGSNPLAFHPGSHFRYGFSADILGAVIEVASGQKFGDFLKENIFLPLGMKDTDFWVPSDKQSRLSKVYENKENDLFLYDYPNLGVSNHMKTAPAFESGGAGLCSTIDDFIPFTQMLLNNGSYNGNTILSEASVKYLSSHRLPERFNTDIYNNMPHLSGYSYSNLMRVMTNSELAYSYGSNGEYGWDGWLGTYMAVDPANKLSFIIMMQRVDSGTTDFTRKIRNVIYSAI